MKQLKLSVFGPTGESFSNFYPTIVTDYNFWSAFNEEKWKIMREGNFREPTVAPDLHYFTYRYRLADIMYPYTNLTDGLFISQKCFDVFVSQLCLPPYKLYPIYYKKKGVIVSDYYYIYFYFGFRDSIVFEKSPFMYGEKYAHSNESFNQNAIERDIYFDDYQHFDTMRRELDNGMYDTEKLVFKPNSISKYDIFPVYLQFDSELYLSEKFVEVYEKMGLTGLYLKPFNYFFEEE